MPQNRSSGRQERALEASDRQRRRRSVVRKATGWLITFSRSANWRQNAHGISVRELDSESFGGLNREDNLHAP
jgi:hypothetical protein